MGIMEPYGLKNVYITMTKQELIDKLQPYFYKNPIKIHIYKDGDIGVFINGFFYGKRHIKEITGIDLDMIRIKKSNLDLWKEVCK